MFKKIFIIVFAVLWHGSAFAAHPLITDDTGTQGKGKYQVEVNSELTYEKERQYNTDEEKWETKKRDGRRIGNRSFLRHNR